MTCQMTPYSAPKSDAKRPLGHGENLNASLRRGRSADRLGDHAENVSNDTIVVLRRELKSLRGDRRELPNTMHGAEHCWANRWGQSQTLRDREGTGPWDRQSQGHVEELARMVPGVMHRGARGTA